ncbi:unnamed protein product, partial [Sphacelaria rigidula]
MSSENKKGDQGGPGPPFSSQMMPFYAPNQGGKARPNASSPDGSSPSSANGFLNSSHHQQSQHMMASPEQQGTVGGGAVGQPGLRIGAHPATGAGFVPVSFEAMCGTAASGSTARPQASTAPASGYYPFSSSVTSMYPFAFIGQSSAGAAAAAVAAATAATRSTGGGGLEQERLGTRSSVELMRPATAPGASLATRESAWGSSQYPPGGPASASGHAVGAWAGLSIPATRRKPQLSVTPSPSVPTLSPALQPSPSPAVVPTASCAAPASPVGNKARTTPTATTPAATTSVGSGSSNSRDEQKQQAAVAAVTSGEDVRAKSHGEQTEPSSTAAAADGGSEASREKRSRPTADAGEADEGRNDEQADENGEFETDSLGKRRRLTAEERLQRSRERNQLHARKTRQRKKAQLQLLTKRSAELQAEQQRLRQAITDRRTASILLGMSGSDDTQGTGGQGSKTKASRDHPPALVSMSGRGPRAGMLSAVESDDTGDGSGKGAGGNGSDDLGSESTAGTSCSTSSSGRTSSETNSSDGTVGGSGGSVDGGYGAVADKLPKVGNPGDTERLLELSQKTRSECTPEELEQIRRERNRMHAKRTRDRKKLHLEATEGMIARLEQENRKLRDSMKAMGGGRSSTGSSGAGVGGTDIATFTPSASPSTAVSQATASPKPEMCVPSSYSPPGQALPLPMQQVGGTSPVFPTSAPPSQQQPAAGAPQRQPQHEPAYPGHHHPFIHQQVAVLPPHGSHMPQHERHQHLHGGPVVPQHAYPAQHHHVPQGAHPLVHQQQSMPQGSSRCSHTQSHMGSFYPHSYSPNGGGTQGPPGGAGSGASSGNASAAATGLVRSEINSFGPSGHHLTPIGFMRPSNHQLTTQQQILGYQGSAAFASLPLGKAAPHMIAAPSQGQQQQPQQQHQQQQQQHQPQPQHIYPVADPRGYKGWDALEQAQAAQLPQLAYAHAHGHGYGHGAGVQIANFSGVWGASAPGVGSVGAGSAGAQAMETAMPGAIQGAAAAAAPANIMQQFSSKIAPPSLSSSSVRGVEPLPPPKAKSHHKTSSDGAGGSGSASSNKAVERRRDGAAGGGISEAKNWGVSASTTVRTVMSSSGTNCSGGSSNSSVGGSAGGSAKAGGGKSSASGHKSSSSAAGNGPARHLARARADLKARAEKAAAEAAEVAAATVSKTVAATPLVQEIAEQKEQDVAEKAAAADDEKSKKLDLDLSRGCQEAWQHLRRERSAKRKNPFTAAASAGGAGDGTEESERHRHQHYHNQSSSPGGGAKHSASSGSMDYSESESNGDGSGSAGEGSVGEGSVASRSSCSSWGESEESSVLPASTVSSEDGRGRHSASGSEDGMSRGSSPCSESGSDEVGARGIGGGGGAGA